jgi:thiol-disulfide isomerase/thioredoxin
MRRFEQRARASAALGLLAVVAAAACKTDPPPPSSSSPSPAQVRVVAAPGEGTVEPLVRDAMAAAAAEKRVLVVYVGATWCEPCQRFHRAAERRELDAAFPTLTLLEFDLDRDGERLRAAGYESKYVPLFALPAADGKASGKQMEGSIKGEGAVAEITPRLQALLSEEQARNPPVSSPR